MFDVTALKGGIESAKKNIRIFKDAIKKEESTIIEYQTMITYLERKQKAAAAKVALENPNGDSSGLQQQPN